MTATELIKLQKEMKDAFLLWAVVNASDEVKEELRKLIKKGETECREHC